MFKVKTVTIDIDLDMSDVKGIDAKDKILKSKINTDAEKIIEWGKTVKGLIPHKGTKSKNITASLMKHYDGNFAKAIDDMIGCIDFWYGKGNVWWLKFLDAKAIVQIFNFLVAELFKVEKKKTTLKQ